MNKINTTQIALNRTSFPKEISNIILDFCFETIKSKQKRLMSRVVNFVNEAFHIETDNGIWNWQFYENHYQRQVEFCLHCGNYKDYEYDPRLGFFFESHSFRFQIYNSGTMLCYCNG